jgi:hypothetical protein
MEPLSGLDGQMARDREPWTEQEDALLGTDIDRVIAVKLKRSSTAVANRRMKLGIAAFKNSAAGKAAGRTQH